METTPSLDFWAHFAAVVALEVCLVVAITFAAQHLVRSAAWRRAIWQTGATGILVLLMVELTGGGELASRWMPQREKALASRAPEPGSFSVRIAENASDALGIPGPIVEPSIERRASSWWPGIIWLVGSALLLGRIAFIRLVFLLGAKRTSISDAELLARIRELSARLNIRGNVRVVEIGALRGPIAFGIARPTVALPEDFAAFTARQQDAMLIHELAHLAARDPLWYSLTDVLAALMWWHPLVWWLRRRLHAATEVAADEASALVEDGPNILAAALVELGGRLLQRQRLGLLGIRGNGFRSDLGRRVERLMSMSGQEWKPATTAWSFVVKMAGPAVLVVVTLCCGAWMMPPGERGYEWQDSIASRTLDALFARNDRVEASASQTFIGVQPAGEPVVLDRAAKPSPTNDLHTRTFKLDPVTFIKGIREATPQRIVPANETILDQSPPLDTNRLEGEGVRIRRLDASNGAGSAAELLKDFFSTVGVEFSPPKAIFWNDRLGMLMVRATLDDLETVEKAVQVLNTAPPQVTIETKIAEMPAAAFKQLGLEWLGTPVSATISSNQSRSPLADAATANPSNATVLTEPQYRLLLSVMEQKTGLDLLAAPSVTTLSARQAQIKVVSVKTVVSGVIEDAAEKGVFGLVTSQHECGPMVDVVPFVRADGYTIDLRVIATLTEFLGYEPTTETVKVRGSDGSVESAPMPLPQYRVRQAVANPVIWDGQTIVLGMGSADGKERVAFVTTTIIDPAGNRVHSEDEGEFRMRGIPPQHR
jgi:hypothetical protein